jgi:hypothetical protein
MRVVINRCYGGFGLSDAAYKKLNEWGIPIVDYIEEERDSATGLFKPFAYEGQEVILRGKGRSPVFGSELWDCWTRDNRAHPLVVRVVEELGKEASDSCADLGVVEIPDGVDYEIDEYDGLESVHERSWS